MTEDQVFHELLRLVERSAHDIDVSKLKLDDEPFWVHGIDSITLLRLVDEVESTFGIELDDADTLVAFSFDRLVALIIERLRTRASGAGARVNLLDAIQQHAGDRFEVRQRTLRHDDVAVPAGRLLRIAASVGQRIPEPVDGRPQVVLVAAMDPLTTLVGFLAALTVEALPLVLPSPKALGGYETYLARLRNLAAQFGNRPVVALEPGLLPDRAALTGLPVVDLPADVATERADASLPPLSSRRSHGDDIAFLQMTSASTGDAKLVAITHANICANLDAMLADLSLADADRACSWLPLYHDMGLIGGALFPLYAGFSTILMRPNEFVRKPARWLRTLHDFQVTFTGAPNFALDYAAMALSDADLEGLDLSSVRRFGLAAEPIHRSTVQRWLDRFGPYGFRADAFVPGLGMAESTLSTTTRVGRPPRYVVVETAFADLTEAVRVLERGSCTFPAQPAPRTAGVPVMSLGTPLAGISVDLRDDAGAPVVGEHRVGEICVRGASVAGYYEPVVGKVVPVADGVLRSGDLGFFDDGELFVLGRMKNVIIRNGANHLATLIEQQVADVLSVLAHGVLILDEDIYDPTSPIHAVIEMAEGLPAPTPAQLRTLRGLDLPVDVVTFAAGSALPRTTSGKKRYQACRKLLVAGELDALRRIDLRQ